MMLSTEAERRGYERRSLRKKYGMIRVQVEGENENVWE